MSVANKLTFSRMILAILILFLFLFPWQDMGISFPNILVMGRIIVDIKYVIAGVLFLGAIATDFLDGYLARNEKKANDMGAVLDFVADRVLVDGILIVLSYNGFISVLIPILVILRDLIVDGIRIMVAKNGTILKPTNYNKMKTFCMYTGIAFSLFYNLPFEIWGIFFSEILIDIGAILSVVTGYLYYVEWKEKYKRLDEKI